MATPTLADFQALLAEADVETTRIAARITDLMDDVQPGMSDADVNSLKGLVQAEVDKLKGVGVVPDPNTGPVARK